MSTTIAIAEGIIFADQQSQLSFEHVKAGGLKSGGLLVITGAMTSGKTRLAKSILGEDHPKLRLSHEKDLGRTLNSAKLTVFFDDINLTCRVTPKTNRAIVVPLDSPAIEAAIDRGILVVITGIRVPISTTLEKRATRIHLKLL